MSTLIKNVTLILAVLMSNTSFAGYKTYNPSSDLSLLNEAIMGACHSENQKYDTLDSYLKNNIENMSEDDSDAFSAELKEVEKQRWYCLEKELNKKSITLNLKSLFEQNGL